MALFRASLQELGKWLTYEAMREWMATQTVEIQTPLATTAGDILDPEIPIAIVPVLRAGLAMSEGCQTLLPQARVYHLGMVRDEVTLLPTCYLNRLPETISPQTRILIPEPMLATGGTLAYVLKELSERGADIGLVRVITALAAPPGLQKLGVSYPNLCIYAAMIDENLNDQGFIVPGLGDAGDRAFGTNSL
jgi:uracil phosphoribosyltransferase